MPSTGLAVDSEIIDLTQSESTCPQSQAVVPRARAKDPSTNGSSDQHQDHMHEVVALLRPVPPNIDLTRDENTDPDVALKLSRRQRVDHEVICRPSIQNIKQERSALKQLPTPNEALSIDAKRPSLRRLPISRRSSKVVDKKSSRSFPFMNFPQKFETQSISFFSQRRILL